MLYVTYLVLPIFSRALLLVVLLLLLLLLLLVLLSLFASTSAVVGGIYFVRRPGVVVVVDVAITGVVAGIVGVAMRLSFSVVLVRCGAYGDTHIRFIV